MGDLDLFKEEAQEYARRLRDTGVEATFRLVEGAYHGSDLLNSGEKPKKSQKAFLNAVILAAKDSQL